MKAFILLLTSLSVLTLPMSAHATYYQLVRCDFRFVPEYGKSVYVGVYKSQYGNLFTRSFSSYCPPAINE